MNRQRTTRHLLIFLLLGVALNIAVAWSLALAVNIRGKYWVGGGWASQLSPDEWGWVVQWFEVPGARTVITYWHPIRGDPVRPAEDRSLQSDGSPPSYIEPTPPEVLRPYELRAVHPPDPDTPRQRYGNLFESRGWPMLSLWCEFDSDWPSKAVPRVEMGGIVLDNTYRVLPLRPIALGFVVNSCFYSACLWLLFSIPMVVIKRMRSRHRDGTCTNCGYDLREADHAACPECGDQKAPR